MFTIKELEDKWNDYESSCLLTIKQLLTDCKKIEFDSDLLEDYPYCIDCLDSLSDCIILTIYVSDNKVYIVCKDRETGYIRSDLIQYFLNINYIDIIEKIKKQLRNGKTNLGKEA